MGDDGGAGGDFSASHDVHCDTSGHGWSSCGLGQEELSQIPWADNDSGGVSGTWVKKDEAEVYAATATADAGRRRSSEKNDGRQKQLIGPGGAGGGADCCCLL